MPLRAPGGGWYVESCPTPFDFRSRMPDTVYFFAGLLLDSGWHLAGEAEVRDCPRGVRDAVERGANFDLYIDLPEAFWRAHGHEIFDVYTKSYEWDARTEDMPAELAELLATEEPLPEGPGGT